MSHGADPSAYGLWTLVFLNSAIFIFFAFSFFKPRTRRDWRTFGTFSAFVVALFVEMYGFPLTVYLLSGWIARRYPGIRLARREEAEAWTAFGEAYARYESVTPAFFPRLGGAPREKTA